MIILLGFIVLLACLIVGVRFGGLGLAAVSGLGLAFYVFVIGLVPGKPPIDVMLTIMAVVTCSGFLQASKGLDVMLVYAEKLLRKNPKRITILAPITTWFLTVLCGTGHVVYTMSQSSMTLLLKKVYVLKDLWLYHQLHLKWVFVHHRRPLLSCQLLLCKVRLTSQLVW